ncbi:phosphate ABC transporter permease PstA [Desulfobacca acetoxidans]|uniref:Phosphate transport system permease protein PstA n=1 Tax=Desulfobacca acetoxidans (strain ATCC 700848 / DSM 11109 / ASRB2) TaxID=880072 RepID=F2NDV0_DESAR|nr:phosphate ABC transporter permease PstA [Desulfobacca acetoxidans]AEB10447.1 phosphate ABC transporter, inner membrane subunit PstA [Desulfobacca acetoxidans DSM 11109]HAY21619.1 phosphate ABC transporter permease PtsA [Desulfobacterales bacterium]
MRIDPFLTQRLMKSLLWSLTGLTLFFLIFIIAFISVKGLPQVTFHFLFHDIEDMGRAGGIFPTIVTTIYLTLVALAVASPLGVGTAIYLTEYTREGWVTRLIRFGAECLAGVPSIILGLFGFVLFVIKLNLGWSMLSGGLSLAIMVLPTIIRTSEEALKAVPREYHDVCYSLGIGKWRTITRVVLPCALPGIMTGIVLSIGRSIGETAVVLFTAGASLRLPATLFDSGRSMAVHFYILAREGLSMPNAYGTAAILIISILLINISAYSLMQRFIRRYS